MRILIVVEPGVDGVFRHVEGLVHFLLAEGETVHLAYSDRRGSAGLVKLVETVLESGGECLNLGVSNAPEPRDIPALVRLWRFAKRLRPDVIHGHSSKAGVLTRALACLGISARFFYHPHAYYGLTPRKGDRRALLYNTIESVAGRIGTTVNISHDETSFARTNLRLPAERIRTIHNPVDARAFTPADAAERAHWRRQLGLPEHGKVLGFIGRISFQKDPQTLYRSLAPVFAAHAELTLFQVGKGDLDDELRALSRELKIDARIVRMPYLDEPRCFYKAVDALAVTSRYEAGWPIVVLEALASDLPMIVSEAPGTSDIGQAGLSHCWTARAEDVNGFTSAIRAWLSDGPRVSNHREVALARFSPEKCFGAVLAEYRRQVGAAEAEPLVAETA